LKKSTTRILSLFLAFLIAFTSVNVPSMAAQADVDFDASVVSEISADAVEDAVIADETTTDETVTDEAVTDEVVSDDEAALEDAAEVTDETESEDNSEADTTEEITDESNPEEVTEEVTDETEVLDENLEQVSEEALAANIANVEINPDGENKVNVVSAYSDYYIVNNYKENPDATVTTSVYPVQIITDADLKNEYVRYVRINGNVYENINYNYWTACYYELNENNGFDPVPYNYNESPVSIYTAFIPAKYIPDTNEEATVEFILADNAVYGEDKTIVESCDVLICSAKFHSGSTSTYVFDQPLSTVRAYSPYHALGRFYTPNSSVTIKKIEFGKNGTYTKQTIRNCELTSTEKQYEMYNRAYPTYYRQIGGNKYELVSIQRVGKEAEWYVSLGDITADPGIYDIRVTMSNDKTYVYKNAVKVDEMEKLGEGDVLAQDVYYINDKSSAEYVKKSCDGKTNLNFLIKDELVSEYPAVYLALDGKPASTDLTCIYFPTAVGYTNISFKKTLTEGEHTYKLIILFNSGNTKCFEGSFTASKISVKSRKASSTQYLGMDSRWLWISSEGFKFNTAKKEKVASVKLVHKESDYVSKAIKISSSDSWVNQTSAIAYNEGFKNDYEVNGEAIHVDLGYYSSCYPYYAANYFSCNFPTNFTPASINAPEGLYDVEITTTLNNKYTLEEAFYITNKPLVENFKIAKSGAYVCDPDSDYVAVAVYGKNLNGVIPTFYSNATCEDKDKVLVFDETDSECASSPQTYDGIVYKLKRSNPSADLSGNLFVKFDKEETIYVGAGAIGDGNGNNVATSSEVYDSKYVVYPFYAEGNTKFFKIYMGKAVSEYVSDNNVRYATVKIRGYDNNKTESYITTTAATFPFANDEQGRLLIDIPSSSAVYSRMNGYSQVEVTIEGIGTTKTDTGYFTTGVEKNIVKPEFDIYFIDATDMSNKMDFFVPKGGAGLTANQVAKLAELPAAVLECYDGEEFIGNNIVKFVSAKYDTFTYVDDGVYFDESGNMVDSPNPDKIGSGKLTSLESPTREGYAFGGWYLDSKFSKKLSSSNPYTFVGGKNVNLYAKWIAREYTVRIWGYNQNNPAQPIDLDNPGAVYEFKVKYNEKFKLDINNIEELKRPGYIINNISLGGTGVIKSYSKDSLTDYTYHTLADFDFDEYFFGDQKTVEFYVRNDETSWIKAPFKIVYHLNGGKVVGDLMYEFEVSGENYEIPENVLKAPAGFEFAGWYEDSSFTGNPVDGVALNVTGDIHLYAKWVPQEITIKFVDKPYDISGNSETLKSTSTKTMADIECYAGEYVKLPANVYTAVTKDDSDTRKYIFAGWCCEESEWGDTALASFMPAEGNVVELYPMFEPIGDEYDIHYFLNIGDSSEWDSEKYTTGTAKKLTKVPTKEGYIFVGWSYNGEIIKSISADERTENIDLVAQWTPKTYQFVFKANGGKGKDKTVKLSYDDILHLTGYREVFTKKGYQVCAWEVNGTSYNYDEDINIAEKIGNRANNAKITVKAKWTPCEYHYTLHDRFGGDISGNYSYSGKTQYIATPGGIDGVKFIGWAYDSYDSRKYAAKYNSKVKNTVLNAKVSGDLQLYSVYEIPYKVRLHSDKFDGDKEEVKLVSGYKEGIKKALPANTFKSNNPNMRFTGWGLKHQVGLTELRDYYCADKGSIDAKGLYDNGDMYYEPSLNSMIVDLYPMWEFTPQENTFMVYFDDGYNYDAKGMMKNQTISFGKPTALSKNKFSRTDAVFVGWMDQDGNTYSDGEKIAGLTRKVDGKVVDVSYPTIMSEGSMYYSSLILTAQWRETFELTFNPNVADETDVTFEGVKKYTYNYGTVMSAKTFATVSVPTRDGYSFAGWYTDKACKKAFKQITAKTSGDITLYAKWTPKKYTISYDSGITKTGVTVKGKMKSSTFTFGKATAIPKCGYTVAGMKLVGWCDEHGAYYEPGQKIQGCYCDGKTVYPEGGKMKLFAIWEPIEYAVKFVDKTTNINYGEEYGLYTYHSYTGNANANNNWGANAPLPQPEAIGYVFEGWYKDAKFTTKVESLEHGESGSLTLYAKWRKVR